MGGHLAALPEGLPSEVQRFAWPPPPRIRRSIATPAHGVDNVRMQLLMTDRDFTPEDYEMLLELENAESQGQAGADDERALALECLLQRLPSSTIPADAAAQQCSV